MICQLYKQAIARSLAIPCVVLNRIEIEDELGQFFYVEVVEGNSKTKSCIGIHRLRPTEREIEIAVDQAFRDGFERVYVYGGIK